MELDLISGPDWSARGCLRRRRHRGRRGGRVRAARVGGHAAGLAPAALSAQALAATVSRWWAGRQGDRRGPRLLARAAGFGALAGISGYPLAFVATAALVLLPVIRSRRA